MLNALAARDPITIEWLTEALRGAGALPIGAVIACAASANDAFNSTATHLTLTYSVDAPATAPRRLFLKRNLDVDWAIAAARDEVAFYQTVAQRGSPPSMVIPCYLAAFDEQRGASTLLLEDASETHTAPLTRDDQLAGDSVPDETALDQAIDALAAFHAYWWERPELGTTFPLGGWYGDAERFAAHVERRQREWVNFIAAEGAELASDLRAIYEGALTRLPELWEEGLGAHMTTGRGLTLVQGDCYLTQFLIPRTGIEAPTYLIDFQGIAADLAAFDLALMFAAFWTREQRQEHERERRALRRYHAQLVASGVRDYTWDDLMRDYRLLLTVMLFYPVWDETNGSPRSYWLPKMRCLAEAYQDHCLAGDVR
jgi:hypothetical protein